MARGRFISFEGSEGSGKSTQIGLLARRVEETGAGLTVTREPGGTMLGEEIRRLLQFTPGLENMSAEAELLLFAASRAQLVREVIAPALERGTHVAADRFLDSTTVYQGVARGLGVEEVDRINGFALGGCRPDLTVLLDMDSALAHARAVAATAGEGREDRMEKEPAEFFEKVRQGYLEVAEREPGRFLVVDAGEPPEEIGLVIWKAWKEGFDSV
ncbi:MAG: dTMP kinase [Verrucomicrobiales bacterium]